MFFEAATDAETTATTIAAVKEFVSVPIITAAMIAIATFLVPTFRWTRQLKSDLDVYNGLPDGEEKDYWKARVNQQSERLRTYRSLVPVWDRSLGWVAVVLMLTALISAILYGTDFSWMAPFDWIIFALGLFTGVWASFNTLRGRSFSGFTSVDYVHYIESERRQHARMDARAKARKRLRRIRKAERLAAAQPSTPSEQPPNL